MNRSEIKTGDLLMTITGNVGRVVLLEKPFVSGNINQHIARIRITSENTETQFIYYFISQNKYRINYYKITTGQAYPQISLKQVRDSIIPLPPLKEQQKIAKILTTWDDAISKQEQLITTKERLKKGLMQKLLSGEVRFGAETLVSSKENTNGVGVLTPSTGVETLVSSDNTNGTEVPAPEWEEVKLGDVATFHKGKGISKNDISDEGIECIRYGELYTKYNERIEKVISKTSILKKDLFLSEENNILIPASGETAIDLATASCILKKDIGLGGDINIIRTYHDGVFLSYYLNIVAKINIASLAQGVSVIHLYASQLKSLKIKLPPLKEQQKITQVLTLAD
jgi:type I restriction enzyme S subunit